MAATMHRQPFGELNAIRMQGLASQKNYQNAVTNMLALASSNKPKANISAPVKRSATLAFDDEDFDSENIDPSMTSPAKRSMNANGLATKRPVPPLKTTSNLSAAKTRSSPDHSVNKPTTPTSPLANKFPTLTPANTPLHAYTSTRTNATTSAPAGRSPKHKRIGILTKKRGSLSPFRRIDPPAFPKPTIATGNTGLSFSIDAAISGTLQSREPTNAKPKPQRGPAPSPSLNKPQPKSWSFEIHEDTPQQHATNMMEHSAVTLDISSDDETGSSLARGQKDDDKENVPPPGHFSIHQDTYTAAAGNNVNVTGSPRRAGLAAVDKESPMRDAYEDIPSRAPLGMLKAEDYYASGLHKESVHLVHGETENVEVEARHDDADDEHENDKENDEEVKPDAVVVHCDDKAGVSA